jgi:uncharacterized membrane protein
MPIVGVFVMIVMIFVIFVIFVIAIAPDRAARDRNPKGDPGTEVRGPAQVRRLYGRG